MKESPVFNKKWKKGIKRLAVVFPNKYFGGIYSLGPLIVYNIVNSKTDWVCERVFLDSGDLKNFDLIGFSFQYELDYYNFFKMLEKNGISKDKNRKQVIFAGGPCVNMNYKVLSKYIDFFVFGDVENIILDILDRYDSNKERFLENIKDIITISRYNVVDLNKVDYPLIQPMPEDIDKNFVFGKCFILEIERGCPFNCYFCPLPKIYDKVRYRSLENIKKIIDEGIKINKRKKVVIYSASFSHPKRKEILKYLIDKGLQFSVPSLRVELVDEELLNLIKEGGQRSLTIAPECGESLRSEIGKNVKDEEYFEIIEKTNKLGFDLKLYFMVGIPGQDKKDLDEIIEFVSKIKGGLYISFNPFVPKMKSKFEDYKFDKKKIKEQIKYLKSRIKNAKLKFGSVSSAYGEWKLGHSAM